MGSNLKKLAKKVISSYSLPSYSLQIVQEGKIKTVWMVNAQQRTYCLKRLKHRLHNMHFSIQAQKYLKDRHAQVPGIVKSRKGSLYVIRRGQVFVLYDWIRGTKPDFSSKGDLKKSIKELARFHIASIGFVPRTSCRISTKWGKWPIEYGEMIDQLKSFKRSDKFPRKWHKRIGVMIEQGKRAKKLLSRSHYARWIRTAKKGICHMDFTEANVVKSRNGSVILDMDSIGYDLPIRDLRQIVHAVMLQRGKWDGRLFRKIISWYTSVNPFTAKQRTVLYIDCLFPHLFYKASASLAKKYTSIPFELVEKTDFILKIERAKRKDLLREIKKQVGH